MPEPDPNAWKRGLRVLTRGVYVDDANRTLHFDPAEILEAGGYAVTPENQDMIERVLRNQYPEMERVS